MNGFVKIPFDSPILELQYISAGYLLVKSGGSYDVVDLVAGQKSQTFRIKGANAKLSDDKMPFKIHSDSGMVLFGSQSTIMIADVSSGLTRQRVTGVGKRPFTIESLTTLDIQINLHEQYKESGQAVTLDVRRRLPRDLSVVMIAAGCSDGLIRFWDLSTQAYVGSTTISKYPVTALVPFGSYRDRLFAVSDIRGYVISMTSWRVVTSFILIGRPTALTTPVEQGCPATPAQDPLVATGYPSGHVEVWSFAGDHDRNPPAVARPRLCQQVSQFPVTSVTFCPDSPEVEFRVLVCAGTKMVYILEPGRIRGIRLEVIPRHVLHLGSAVLFATNDDRALLTSLIVPTFLLQQEAGPEEEPEESPTTLFLHDPGPSPRGLKKAMPVGAGQIEIKQMSADTVARRQMSAATMPEVRCQSPAPALVALYASERNSQLLMDGHDMMTLRMRPTGPARHLPPLGNEGAARPMHFPVNIPQTSPTRNNVTSAKLLGSRPESIKARLIRVESAAERSAFQELDDHVEKLPGLGPSPSTALLDAEDETDDGVDPATLPRSPTLPLPYLPLGSHHHRSSSELPAEVTLEERHTRPPPGRLRLTSSMTGNPMVHNTPVGTDVDLAALATGTRPPPERRVGSVLTRSGYLTSPTRGGDPGPWRTTSGKRGLQGAKAKTRGFSSYLLEKAQKKPEKVKTDHDADKVIRKTYTTEKQKRMHNAGRRPSASITTFRFDRELSNIQFGVGDVVDRQKMAFMTAQASPRRQLTARSVGRADVGQGVDTGAWTEAMAAAALMTGFSKTVRTRGGSVNAIQRGLMRRIKKARTPRTHPGHVGVAQFGMGGLSMVGGGSSCAKNAMHGHGQVPMGLGMQQQSLARRATLGHADSGSWTPMIPTAAQTDDHKGFSGHKSTSQFMARLNAIRHAAEGVRGNDTPRGTGVGLEDLPDKVDDAARPPRMNGTRSGTHTNLRKLLEDRKRSSGARREQITRVPSSGGLGTAVFGGLPPATADHPEAAAPIIRPKMPIKSSRVAAKREQEQAKAKSSAASGTGPEATVPLLEVGRAGSSGMMSMHSLHISASAGRMSIPSEASSTDSPRFLLDDEHDPTTIRLTEMSGPHTARGSAGLLSGSGSSGDDFSIGSDVMEREVSLLVAAVPSVRALSAAGTEGMDSSDVLSMHGAISIADMSGDAAGLSHDPTGSLTGSLTMGTRSMSGRVSSTAHLDSDHDFHVALTESAVLSDSDMESDMAPSPPPPPPTDEELDMLRLADRIDRLKAIEAWHSTRSRLPPAALCAIDMATRDARNNEWHGNAGRWFIDSESESDESDEEDEDRGQEADGAPPDRALEGVFAPIVTARPTSAPPPPHPTLRPHATRVDRDAFMGVLGREAPAPPRMLTTAAIIKADSRGSTMRPVTAGAADVMVEYFRHMNAFAEFHGQTATTARGASILTGDGLVGDLLLPAGARGRGDAVAVPAFTLDVSTLTDEQLMTHILTDGANIEAPGVADLESEWASTLREMAITLLEDTTDDALGLFRVDGLRDQLADAAAELERYIAARRTLLAAQSAALLLQTLEWEKTRRIEAGAWPVATEPETVADVLWAMSDDELEECMASLANIERVGREHAAMVARDVDVGPQEPFWTKAAPATPDAELTLTGDAAESTSRSPSPEASDEPEATHAAFLDELRPVLRHKLRQEEYVRQMAAARDMQEAQVSMKGMVHLVYGASRGKYRARVSDAIQSLTSNGFGAAVAALVGYDVVLSDDEDLEDMDHVNTRGRATPTNPPRGKTPTPTPGVSVTVDGFPELVLDPDPAPAADPFVNARRAPAVEEMKATQRHMLTEEGVYIAEPLVDLQTPLGRVPVDAEVRVGLGSTMLEPDFDDFEQRLRDAGLA